MLQVDCRHLKSPVLRLFKSFVKTLQQRSMQRMVPLAGHQKLKICQQELQASSKPVFRLSKLDEAGS